MKIQKAVIAVMLLASLGSFALPETQNEAKSKKKISDQKTAYRTVTDMAGRKVKIPTKISKVLCTSPPLTTATYIVAPDKLGALLGGPSREGSKYLPEKYRSLPSVPWGRGSNATSSYEAYIAAHPDIIFDGCGRIGGETVSENTLSSVNRVQEKVGTIPVVCIDSNISNYEAIFKFMGDVLNVSARTNALISYNNQALAEVRKKVSAIPYAKRVRVYYAEGADGLQSNPAGSRHTQLIELCGGINVVESSIKEISGATTVDVTKESVLLWNPDVVITASSRLIAQVYDDETWKQTAAVQNHRVYLIPSKPFNWFDRPPGANRIVGIPFLARLFYPNLFSDDWFRKKAKEFYKLFYQYDLSDSDLTSLLTE